MNPVHGRHLSLIDPSARADPLSPFRTHRNLTSSDRSTRLLLEGGIDKSRAIHEELRISEKTLFTIALIGGVVGRSLGGFALLPRCGVVPVGRLRAVSMR